MRLPQTPRRMQTDFSHFSWKMTLIAFMILVSCSRARGRSGATHKQIRPTPELTLQNGVLQTPPQSDMKQPTTKRLRWRQAEEKLLADLTKQHSNLKNAQRAFFAWLLLDSIEASFLRSIARISSGVGLSRETCSSARCSPSSRPQHDFGPLQSCRLLLSLLLVVSFVRLLLSTIFVGYFVLFRLLVGLLVALRVLGHKIMKLISPEVKGFKPM